jgi:CheY-like chemotaxis protein
MGINGKEARDMKIMVVDDEPDIVKVACATLDMNGFDTIKAMSGAECMKLLESGVRPDLILLDIMMPEMDGYAVCQKIKMDERFKKILVVMLSAKTQNRDVVDAYHTGADGYITKPFDPYKMITEIKVYLGLI